MSLAWIVVLILGIVAIVIGVLKKNYVSSTFWFLLAFWALIVLRAVPLL